MPSRQSTRLKLAALKYSEMTPAEREALSDEQRQRYEAMTTKWRKYFDAHPRGLLRDSL